MLLLCACERSTARQRNHFHFSISTSLYFSPSPYPLSFSLSLTFRLADGFVHTIRVLRFVFLLNRLDSMNCAETKMKKKRKKKTLDNEFIIVYYDSIQLCAVQRKQNRTNKKNIVRTNLWQTDRKRNKNRNEKNGPNIQYLFLAPTAAASTRIATSV